MGPERRSPAPHFDASTSVSAWLDAWVRFKIAEHPRAAIAVPSGYALYIYCTIGFDAALSPDGTVWVNDYHLTDQVNWEVADEGERIRNLVKATRIYPELAALLPTRPDCAITCDACTGTGQVVGPLNLKLSCLNCNALGWISRGRSNDPSD